MLYFQTSVEEASSLQDDVCSHIRTDIQQAAQKDLSKAYHLLVSLRTIQERLKLALLKQKVKYKTAREALKIVNRIIEVRYEMKMAKWNYDGLSTSNQKEFIGICGYRINVSGTIEEAIDLYVAFRANQRRLALEERKLSRSLFLKTKCLSTWNQETLQAYRRRPSLSRVLQGINLLPKNITDLESDLHLIVRYLPNIYTSEKLEKPPNALERATLMKVEEVVARQRQVDQFFLSKLECFEDWFKQLPEWRTTNIKSPVINICKPGS